MRGVKVPVSYQILNPAFFWHLYLTPEMMSQAIMDFFGVSIKAESATSEVLQDEAVNKSASFTNVQAMTSLYLNNQVTTKQVGQSHEIINESIKFKTKQGDSFSLQ